jgi:sugar phosphate isomerase/epimerase
MQFCLSSRLFTIPGENDRFELGIDAFIQLAKSLGYDGITLRPGQLDSTTPVERIEWIADLLDQDRMAFSFVMGGPLSDAKSYESSCKLIEHAARIGCKYVQPSVPSSAGIPWLQKLCDFASEREISISPQIHGNTIHDTVPHCLELSKNVKRKNFGFNFETAQLLIQKAELRGGNAVRALAEHIFTVCVQNYKLQGTKVIACLPGDPEGVDFADLFGALNEIGFDGFVTHISARYPDMENVEVCRAYIKSLQPLMGIVR